MRGIAARLARALINAAPVPRGKRFAARKLFPLLRQHVCRVSPVSPELAPGLQMELELDAKLEYMLWMLPDFDDDAIGACLPFVPRGGICIDAGANVGHWSLLFSHFVGPDGRVWAFEPFPSFFERLERNIELNRLSNVTAIRRALSDHSGTLEFEGPRCRFATQVDSPVDSRIRISCGTLSEFIEENQIPRVDFVKMDIEGAELLALRGMERHFRKGWRPVFCLELNEGLCERLGYSTRDVKKYLAGWGYTGRLLDRGRLVDLDPNATHDLADALFLPSGG